MKGTMMKELIAAAEAVIARWESPSWKDAQMTGTYIYALRNAVEAVRAQADDTTMREELNFATGALERQSERIALLEGLLREALPNEHGTPEWRERIRAALED